MKALTFLGISAYDKVTYVWRDTDGERTYTTDLFPEAVAHILNADRIIVFVTPQVRKHSNLQELSRRLGEFVETVDIPEGKSESELWKIFDRIAEAVGEEEEIILDITHAFRSLPLVVFGVAVYLRLAKNVRVRRVIYGAYEAREPMRTPAQPEDRAPVFDLTPLLDLMDWLSGAEALLRRGDFRTMADRMQRIHQSLWREEAVREQAVEELPRKLQNVAGKLRSLSQALHLSRPRDVMQTAYELGPMLDSAQEEFQQWAKPFAIILEEVQRELEELAYRQPDRLDVENLRKQLALIEFYLKKELPVQAVTLAREWLINQVILQRGYGNWLGPADRKEAEEALGDAVQKWSRRKQAEVPEWLERWPLAHTAAEVWGWLSQLRNDVAHCGMRSNAAPAESIAQRAKEIPQRLRLLLDKAPESVLWGGRVIIDLKALYGDTAKLDELPLYLEQAKEQAGEGNDVILTGQAPIWLYLAIAHALHGRARRLWYNSPVTGDILIFDHSVR